MVSKRLSEKQQRILGFLQNFLSEHHFPPTVRDIQRGCDISSTSVVDYNLQVLQKSGHIRRSPDISRGIELLGQERGGLLRFPSPRRVPILGAIAAGQPIPVFDDVPVEDRETVEVPQSLAGNTNQMFALRVRGQSMIDALIDDGDIVVIEPVTRVRDGEMVAAWLKNEQETTLKKLYRENGRIRLQPANRTMQPIYADPNNVEIKGRVAAVIRNM
ncbi:MAG: repressor LexA [Dehalococcoidia bacterium]|nr:repressor LexA [Dehalococcoidia bacterium]